LKYINLYANIYVFLSKKRRNLLAKKNKKFNKIDEIKKEVDNNITPTLFDFLTDEQKKKLNLKNKKYKGKEISKQKEKK
jgi:hypothetical protein